VLAIFDSRNGSGPEQVRRGAGRPLTLLSNVLPGYDDCCRVGRPRATSLREDGYRISPCSCLPSFAIHKCGGHLSRRIEGLEVSCRLVGRDAEIKWSERIHIFKERQSPFNQDYLRDIAIIRCVACASNPTPVGIRIFAAANTR
jgi:hypothetical protein